MFFGHFFPPPLGGNVFVRWIVHETFENHNYKGEYSDECFRFEQLELRTGSQWRKQKSRARSQRQREDEQQQQRHTRLALKNVKEKACNAPTESPVIVSWYRSRV